MNYPGFKITIEPVGEATIEGLGCIVAPVGTGAGPAPLVNRMSEGRIIAIIPPRTVVATSSANLSNLIKFISLVRQKIDTSGLTTAIDALAP